VLGIVYCWFGGEGTGARAVCPAGLVERVLEGSFFV